MSGFTIDQQANELAEDKKCRICGFADTKNVNIFNGSNCKALLTKILTVYPIVLYQNDPLPKNICKKCIYNVTFMYNDILRVMKTQAKWISNVRSIQPNHNYIRVLDLIESSNSTTTESIRLSFGEQVHEQTVNRALLLNELATGNANEKSSAFTTAGTSTTHNVAGSSSQSSKLTIQCSKSPAKRTEDTPAQNKSPEIKTIKSILELNGCSLLTVGAAKNSQRSDKNDSNLKPLEAQTTEIKEEPLYATDGMAHDTPKSSNFLAPPPLTVKCRYCPLQFNSLETLATHQLVHMRLSVQKIFQKQYLPKSVRRGRLITVQNRKCIRCLNCWRVFVDNKSILDHWAGGECDFYCHICGKEFAQAPKMLREHVPAAHGISYRSSKVHKVGLPAKILSTMDQIKQDVNSDLKVYQAVSEQEPLPSEEDSGKSNATEASTSKATIVPQQTAPAPRALPSSAAHSSKKPSSQIKNVDGTVSCHICLKAFQNFKARNSHMRKHKPSYAYGDVVLPPNAGIDVYVKVENNNRTESKAAPEAADATNAARNTTETPKSGQSDNLNAGQASQKPKSSTTNVTGHSTNVVRGVRTKFVNRRNEVLSGIKVKSISDLQNTTPYTHSFDKPQCTSTPFCGVAARSGWVAPPSTSHDDSTPAAAAAVIKEEPMDMESPAADSVLNTMWL